MAKNYPPDKMKVTGGDAAWPTDVDEDGTVYKTGGTSMKFKNTTPSAIYYVLNDEFYPCAAGDLFRASGWVRADSIAAGNKMKLFVQWYTGAYGYISTSGVHDAVLNAANAWEYKAAVVTAPATAAFFRVLVGKVNTAFNGWHDSFEITRMPHAFRAKRSVGQVIANGADRKINNNSEDFDYGGAYDSAVNYRFTVKQAGVYAVNIALSLTTAAAPDGGMRWFVNFYKNGGSLRTVILQNDVVAVNTAGTVHTWYGSYADIELAVDGDFYEVYLNHDNTADMTVGGGSAFGMAKVE